MASPIVNLDELTFSAHGHGERFAARLASITAGLGATKLGARLVVLPPGKRTWPFHSHHVNEEMFVILDGHGRLRFGAEEFALRPGDVAVCPPGGAETAHQILNDSDADLRYLAISTMEQPDVMEYPDSGKIGVFAGAPPGGDASARRLAMFVPADAGVDYWKDET